MIENYIKEADRVTYLIPKEVDHHCAGRIIAELDALIEGCGVRKIVFDMKQTEFMDSSGIGLIMGRHRSMESIGGEVIVRNPPQHIRRVMRLSGMERIARIQMDAPAAQPEEPAERRDEQ